ncbi:uncharacterized protein MCYG_05017 [Microsporum canis CBS 113480]|uniref:Uncharacterized protein n=1 Tax=Arthroderma otae (strain ATCC MYA-4605 / CBS 113480) TaxID=554155 RepID=C5FQP5_ARTOC|nr:uncharacterized protein MCYG_05017 [Microsporum canis CBS 113480]EEQ32198.1 predicted protein [Microsporum canis CBS 113480]
MQGLRSRIGGRKDIQRACDTPSSSEQKGGRWPRECPRHLVNRAKPDRIYTACKGVWAKLRMHEANVKFSDHSTLLARQKEAKEDGYQKRSKRALCAKGINIAIISRV